MPINPSQTTPKYGVTITTVDPTQNKIEGVLKTGGGAHIVIVSQPTAFRWPIAGESWMVRQENGGWVLDGPFFSQTNPTTILEIPVGDVILDSPTGVVHVMGSGDGSTDFDLTQADAWSVGDIKLSLTTSVGWLVCDGSAVSRSTYAVLFAFLGTTYGVGNGTTTFNLPNYGHPFGTVRALIKY